MRLVLLRLILQGAIVLSLTACETPAPPAPAPAPPPSAPLPPIRRPVAANWRFRAGEVCTASAASNALDLDVTASSKTLTLAARLGPGTATPPTRAVGIEFTGARGTWTVSGRKVASRRIVATQPMTEDQAGQILILLEGGVLRVGRPRDGLPPLQVPNGGLAGRDWFECVRRQLFP